MWLSTFMYAHVGDIPTQNECKQEHTNGAAPEVSVYIHIIHVHIHVHTFVIEPSYSIQ